MKYEELEFPSWVGGMLSGFMRMFSSGVYRTELIPYPLVIIPITFPLWPWSNFPFSAQPWPPSACPIWIVLACQLFDVLACWKTYFLAGWLDLNVTLYHYHYPTHKEFYFRYVFDYLRHLSCTTIFGYLWRLSWTTNQVYLRQLGPSEVTNKKLVESVQHGKKRIKTLC